MADAPRRDEGSDAAEQRLNRLLNMILESAVAALGFDAATVSPPQRQLRDRGGDQSAVHRAR
jgi:hypothetical protein